MLREARASHSRSKLPRAGGNSPRTHGSPPIGLGSSLAKSEDRPRPLAALLRSYRLGHAWLWEKWSEALQERVEDSGELVAGQDESSAFMFAYVDRISGALVEEFGTERERMLRSAEQLRAETVRTILRGDPVDTERPLGAWATNFVRHHVAMRVSSGASEVEGLERAVGEAVAALAGGEPLVIAFGAARFESAWRRTRAGAGGHTGFFVAFGKPGRGSRFPQLLRGGKAGGAHRRPHRRVKILGDELRPRRPPVAAEELFVHTRTPVADASRGRRRRSAAGSMESPVELQAALTLAAGLGPAVLEDRDVGGLAS